MGGQSHIREPRSLMNRPSLIGRMYPTRLSAVMWLRVSDGFKAVVLLILCAQPKRMEVTFRIAELEKM